MRYRKVAFRRRSNFPLTNTGSGVFFLSSRNATFLLIINLCIRLCLNPWSKRDVAFLTPYKLIQAMSLARKVNFHVVLVSVYDLYLPPCQRFKVIMQTYVSKFHEANRIESQIIDVKNRYG